MSRASIHSQRGRARRAVPALLLTLTLLSASPVVAVPQPGDADAGVIATWNEIAVNRITNNGAAASPAAFNYFAFTHLAMYNAVVGITGEYELYRWNKRAPRGASPAAAAAAAAHRILVNYFGTTDAIVADLNTKLGASLADVPDGGAQDKGVAYGVKAADHIIALRMNDGRNAAVTVPVADAAGEWSPTPTANAPFGTAWLGGVTPIAVPSTTHFSPGAPPALDSEEYLDDLEEVQGIGEVNSARSDFQSQTARFFSDAGILPMQGALREFAGRRGLDISDSARMFAAVDTAIADGAGTVWNAKLQYMLWRPVTAIQAAGFTWMPFVTTPPYPDWPSGLCSVVGATSTVMTSLFGPLDLKITSAASGAGVQPRHYTDAGDFTRDAVDARVWSGIHFRFADTAGLDVGTDVANYVVANYFRPTD